jgi:hypothetical protein
VSVQSPFDRTEITPLVTVLASMNTPQRLLFWLKFGRDIGFVITQMTVTLLFVWWVISSVMEW